MTKDIQPIFILPPESTRTTGREAQRANIQAAKLVAQAVRTTLGPKGMDKMLVDSAGEVTVTNDGVTILEEMRVDHPCAKMIVEIAKTQEREVGDGTTTAVVLAGELLGNAEPLLEAGVHPTIVAKGYRLAAAKAQETLASIARPISISQEDLLERIALTAMTGKGVEEAKDALARIVVTAARTVAQGGKTAERSAMKVERKAGGGVADTELINGLALDKERVASSMPSRVAGARILLIDVPLEIKNTEIDARISITDPDKLQAFFDMEERMLRGMVEKVARSGASVVFSQKGIDDLAAHFLAKRGIFAARRVKKSDMERLERASGARIASNLDDIVPEDLGAAGLVEEVKVGDDRMTFVRDCPHARAVTILVRGSTEHIAAEAQRALEDAIGDVSAALASGKVVAGAGAPEMEVARRLHAYATTLSGREQLAVKAFADAIEIIPRTLAENAGLDPIDTLAQLKAAHDNGAVWAGVGATQGAAMDAWEAGVIEPLRIKTQALASAAEVAVMILRIDDVILSGPEEGAQGQPMRHDGP